MKYLLHISFFIFLANLGYSQQFGIPNFLDDDINPINQVKTVDLNEDGWNDVLLYKRNKLLWFENNGNNIFTEHLITTVSNTNGFYPLEVEDLNNDGKLDIIINGNGQSGSNFNYVRWYENLGNENFGTPNALMKSQIYSGSKPSDIKIVDLNGDNKPEIVVLSLSQIGLYKNLGNGNFNSFSLVGQFVEYSGGQEINIADLDGDGHLDILVGKPTYLNAPSSIIWYKNNGNGNFGSAQSIQNGDYCFSLKTIDIDCDGDTDIIASLYNTDKNSDLYTVGEIVLYKNDGSGKFGAKIVIDDYVGLIRELQLVDIDNDFDLDIAVGGDDGVLHWYKNSGSSFPGNPIPISTAPNDQIYDIHFADLDNDEDLEAFAIYDNARSVYWFENNDVSTYAKEFSCTSFEDCPSNWTNIDSDDLDWERESWGTPSWATGPPFAFHGDYYYYVEASAPNYPSKSAILESANTTLHSTTEFLTFKYHMKGYQMGELSVSISYNNGQNWYELWSISGDQGNDWHAAIIDVSSYQYQTVKFRITGKTGSGSKSDIAIDLICLSPKILGCTDPGSCNYDQFANVDDGSCELCEKLTFENGLEGWQNMPGKDFDLTIWSGNTPSTFTGPSYAYEGIHYIYSEASFPNYPYKTAGIVSPCVSFGRYADLWYHMYGKQCGTLTYKASVDNGDTWTTIFTKSGSQGKLWKYSGYIDLFDFFPQINYSNMHNFDLICAVEVVTGSSFRGDIAVDLIKPGCATPPKSWEGNTDDQDPLEVTFDEPMSLQVFPNPLSSSKELKLNISNIDEDLDELQILIYDKIGTLVSNQMIRTNNKSALKEQYTFPEDLPSGIYMIVLSSEKSRITETVIIMD